MVAADWIDSPTTIRPALAATRQLLRTRTYDLSYGPAIDPRNVSTRPAVRPLSTASSVMASYRSGPRTGSLAGKRWRTLRAGHPRDGGYWDAGYRWIQVRLTTEVEPDG